MNKKQIITFISLTVLSVLLAFCIVKYFSSANNFSSFGEKDYKSKDFIDVETNLIEDALDIETTTEVDKEDNSLEVEEVVRDIYREDIPVSNQSFEKIETEAWNKYMESTEEHGYVPPDLNNEIIKDYEKVLDSSDKISEGAISFLKNLTILADNYTATYEECLSYVLSDDFDAMQDYLDGDYNKSVEDFKSLDCLGIEEFEQIKEEYLAGILAQQEGFNIYIKEPSNWEKYNPCFFDSDTYFYNAQQKLIQLLDAYR